MHLKPEELPQVCQLVYELCGIYLDDSKGYLIESRLGRICRDNNLGSFRELVDKVRVNRGALRADVIDAISTHETLFFRDNSFFQAMKHKVLPELLDRKEELGRRDIRIWSAACSTGQEAYSVAILLKELDVPANWNISIVGTDISDKAVEKARRGIYPEHETQRGMDNSRLFRYFNKTAEGWEVGADLRRWCSFKTHNLNEGCSHMGQFDVVLCRNVLIYFDAETKRRVMGSLTRSLTEEGYLIVGGSESLVDYGPEYVAHSHCGGVFYQPKFHRPKYV